MVGNYGRRERLCPAAVRPKMTERELKIEAEARRLWAATQTGPAPKVKASDLLDLIVGGAGVAEYDRLHSPHLRPRDLSRPHGRR